MAANRNEQIYKFVKGICRFINHVYETDTVPEFTKEEYAPSGPLAGFFRRCINFYKPYFLLHEYQYEPRKDNVPNLQTYVTITLKNAAQIMEPIDFLIKCAIHIIAGSCVREKGFSEAPDIVRDAIYEAFVSSEQQRYVEQWFYVQKRKPPIICTPGNAMAITPLNRKRVDKFVRGISNYISHVYETGTEPEPDEKVYTPPESLGKFFHRCINYHKNFLTLHTYDYEDKANQIKTLLDQYTDILEKAAKSLAPLDFLTQCATYIIAGSCLKQLGFVEAPYIVIVAMYSAFHSSEQHKYLDPWF